MGLFSDIKKAHEISADDALSVPAQRIDTLVTDPVSGQQRHRTDYAGTVWYGGLPQIVGGHPLPGRNAAVQDPVLASRTATGTTPGAAGDIRVQASAAVQGGMATSGGRELPDPRGGRRARPDPQTAVPSLVFVAVTAVATLPLGVAYRVTVLRARGVAAAYCLRNKAESRR